MNNISLKSLQGKLKDWNRKLHSDRTSRCPPKVRHVCTHVLSGLRYFVEKYAFDRGSGPTPSIDAPTSNSLPPYDSEEFKARFAVESDILTQDPFEPRDNGVDIGDTGGIYHDDPDGLDIPVEPSVFDDPSFNISNIL